MAELNGRQASTETLVASPSPLVAISGVVFTSAGIVTAAAEASESPSSSGGSIPSSSPAANTEAAASTTTSKSAGIALAPLGANVRAVTVMVGLLYFMM